MVSARELIAKAMGELSYEETVKQQGPEVNRIANEWCLNAAIASNKKALQEKTDQKKKAETYMNTLEYNSKPESFKKLCADKYDKVCKEWSLLKYEIHDLKRKKEISENSKK